MARYFFNVVHGTSNIPDLEGTDLDGLESVRSEALLSVRAIVADDLKAGRSLSVGRRFDITDEAGEMVFSLCFIDGILYPPSG